MKKTIWRALAIMMALSMMFVLFAGCQQDEPEEVVPTPPPAETPVETPTEEPAEVAEPQTLVVGYSQFSQKFSPFFSTTAYDTDVQSIVTLGTIDLDRNSDLILNGKDGVTIPYNGTDYTYYTTANVDVVRNADGTVDYNFTMRDDLVFSDGTPVSIDDLIFSIYVLSDPDYDGSSTIYSSPITGMSSFRTGIAMDIYEKYDTMARAIYGAGEGNSDFSEWTQEQQDAFWNDAILAGGMDFAGAIVDACMYTYGGEAEVGDYYDSDIALGMEWWGFAGIEDGILVTAVTETEYDLASGEFPTLEDYWNELVVAYDGDYATLNAVESDGWDLFEQIYLAFVSEQGPNDPAYGGEVMNIEGVKKTGDYSLTITTDFFEATTIYNMSLPIAPLHYYGDVSLYDYDNNMFGFPKGDLTIVREKTTVPLGGGPYKFLSYEAGVVSFEANELYYKGEPKIKYMRWQEVSDGDKLTGVPTGSLDVSDPSFSKDTIASIKGYNSNGELTGDVITTSTVDFSGYGYIGINAEAINVGGEPGSEASKNLRKALATMLAVYRDTVYNSYYGEVASVIQYPISNISWAAPRPADDGYEIAFSTDVDGNPIYTDSMTELEKYDAALQAAIGFLKAAGYTWDDAAGKFTAAPDGAQLSYEIMIIADGTGDHPSFGVFTSAKEAFDAIGITIEVTDLPITSQNVLWDALDAGTHEFWCAAWNNPSPDPDMYQIYHSSNITGRGGTDSNNYAIDDPELDELIIAARQSEDQAYRKATYKRCFDIILDWAVEVPAYQRQEAYIFSTERVNMATMTPDVTTLYGWMNEIENIEMN